MGTQEKFSWEVQGENAANRGRIISVDALLGKTSTEDDTLNQPKMEEKLSSEIPAETAAKKEKGRVFSVDALINPNMGQKTSAVDDIINRPIDQDISRERVSEQTVETLKNE